MLKSNIICIMRIVCVSKYFKCIRSPSPHPLPLGLCVYCFSFRGRGKDLTGFTICAGPLLSLSLSSLFSSLLDGLGPRWLHVYFENL